MKQPYKTWTKKELELKLKDQCLYYKLSLLVYSMVGDSINDESWNPVLEFDGCTLVQDHDHPCLPCWLHDYHWISGMGGWRSNLIFYWLMLDTGVKKWEAKRRWFGVTLGWYLYYKWIYAAKRNINPYSESMNEFYSFRKNK